jgi:hypothetical protein|tara:strand:- start:184 stop:582 length:399 start_codon:yes stop_codon:yes gene_type:complete
MDKPQPLTLKGTLYWVERNKLNKFSDKYQIVLGNLSEKAVAALDDMGIAAANKGDEKDYFITMKSKNPMRVTDDQGVEYDSDVMIANGSEAVCVVGYYDWSVGTGRSPSMIKCKVTKMIEYVDDTVDEADAL